MFRQWGRYDVSASSGDACGGGVGGTYLIIRTQDYKVISFSILFLNFFFLPRWQSEEKKELTPLSSLEYHNVLKVTAFDLVWKRGRNLQQINSYELGSQTDRRTEHGQEMK